MRLYSCIDLLTCFSANISQHTTIPVQKGNSSVAQTKFGDVLTPRIKITRCAGECENQDQSPEQTSSTSAFWELILSSKHNSQDDVSKAIRTAALNRYKSTDYLADIRKEEDSKQVGFMPIDSVHLEFWHFHIHVFVH